MREIKVTSKRSAEGVVESFWSDLTAVAASDGWSVGRLMDTHFGRGFVLSNGDREIQLRVRVSQLEKGFWGLPFDEAGAVVDGKKEYNVLLLSAATGYVLTPTRLPVLLGRFSRSDAQKSYKINEDKLRGERPFATVADAWLRLRPPT